MSLGWPELLVMFPWVLLALAPYLLGLWAVALLVQITRISREMNARLAAIESALRQRP